MALRGPCRMSRRHPGSKHYDVLKKRRWERTRKAAFERDSYRCTRCSKAGRLEAASLHAHHADKLTDGGDPYDLANIITLCKACHVDEHRRPLTPDEAAWRAFVDEMLG